VPQNVAGGVFRDSSAARCTPDGLLNDGFVEVMTPLFVRSLVEIPAAGWKYELPTPLGFGTRILSRDGVRERGVSCTFSKVLLMERLYVPGRTVPDDRPAFEEPLDTRTPRRSMPGFASRH
jgi:hypothetical protein